MVLMFVTLLSLFATVQGLGLCPSIGQFPRQACLVVGGSSVENLYYCTYAGEITTNLTQACQVACYQESLGGNDSCDVITQGANYPSFNTKHSEYITIPNIIPSIIQQVQGISSNAPGQPNVQFKSWYDAEGETKNVKDVTTTHSSATSPTATLSYTSVDVLGCSEIYMTASNDLYNTTMQSLLVRTVGLEENTMLITPQCKYTAWSEWSGVCNECEQGYQERTRTMTEANCPTPTTGETRPCTNLPACQFPVLSLIPNQFALQQSPTPSPQQRATGSLTPPYPYQSTVTTATWSTAGRALPGPTVLAASATQSTASLTFTVAGDDRGGNGGIIYMRTYGGASIDTYGGAEWSEDKVMVTVEEPVIDCNWTWTEWSDCSRSCGYGTFSRFVNVLTQPQRGGAACPTQNLIETGMCMPGECRDTMCQLSYTNWSPCSRTCVESGETSTRSRVSFIRPWHQDSFFCDGSDETTITETCDVLPCPKDCKYEWSAYTPCTLTCGGGVTSRTLTILQQPSLKGAACPPVNQETNLCNQQLCPKDCVLGWGPWGGCSFNCGGGTRSQKQILVEPAVGGGSCDGWNPSNPLTNVSDCNLQPCVNSCRERCQQPEDPPDLPANDCSCKTGCTPNPQRKDRVKRGLSERARGGRGGGRARSAATSARSQRAERTTPEEVSVTSTSLRQSQLPTLYCCDDFQALCVPKAPTPPPTFMPTGISVEQLSCKARCDTFDLLAPCNCDMQCQWRDNCCLDYTAFCSDPDPGFGGMNNCLGFCGQDPPGSSCSCKDTCGESGGLPCCQNHVHVCAKDCKATGACGASLVGTDDTGVPCYCTADCGTFGDCCPEVDFCFPNN